MIKTWVIALWVILWFIFHMFMGVEVLDTMTYEQTDYAVYFLGIVLAQLIRLGFQVQEERSVLNAPSTRWLRALSSANKDTLITLTVLFAIVFATKDKGISRVFLSTYLVTLWPTLLVLHRYLPVLLTALFFGKTQRFTTILLAGPEKLKQLSGFVQDLPRSGLEVVGVVNTDRPIPDPDFEELPLLGTVEDLNRVITDHAVDQVIVLDSEQNREWYRQVFSVCDSFGCHVMVYNFWHDYVDQPVHFTRHGAHTFFTLQDEPLQNPINRAIKRLMDIAISLPVVFLVLPLLSIWVMIMQSRQAPGPLFFRQFRGGLRKERFKIFKFRSMKVDRERRQEVKQATLGDERIFPFGAMMRRRSIDEFPQFINVLKGDMSVVGPRPHLLQHDDLFAETVGTYRIRHFVKPGLTGLAQVHGFRGEVVDKASIEERVKLDIAYINSWSLRMDLEILFKTLAELFFPSDSAY